MKLYYILEIQNDFSLQITRKLANSKRGVVQNLYLKGGKFFWIREQKIPWKRIQKKELIFFTREFLFLLENGLSYLEILDLMILNQENFILREILKRLKEKIQSGHSLYHSFSSYSAFFGDFYLNLLYIGEESGDLEKILHLLLEELEKKQGLQKKIKALLLYPSILLSFSLFLVLILLYLIFPTFLSLFENDHLELPIITRMLLFFKDCLPWILLSLIMQIGVLYWLFLRKHSPDFQKKIDIFVYQHFYQKGFYSRVLAYRFSRYFEILLEAGFNFQQLLPILEKTIRNQEFQKHFQKMIFAIQSGRKVSDSISFLNLFLQRELYLFCLAEESGDLSFICKKISCLIEEELTDRIQKYFILLEPCIFIFLGICLAFMILGIYLPIFSFSTFL